MKKIRKPGHVERSLGKGAFGHLWRTIAANGNEISRSSEGYDHVKPRDKSLILTAKIIMYDALPRELQELRDYADALIAQRGIHPPEEGHSEHLMSSPVNAKRINEAIARNRGKK